MIDKNDEWGKILDWIDNFIESSIFMATCLYAQKKPDSKEHEFIVQFDTYCQSLMFHMKKGDNLHRVQKEIEQMGKLVTDYLAYCDSLDKPQE